MTMTLAAKTTEVKFVQKQPQVLMYPTDVYSDTVTYIRTERSTPMVPCDGQYYTLVKVGSFRGINPKTDYAANGGKGTWDLLDQAEFAFFKIIMANFAKLASAVFYERYMFSQYGKNASGGSTNSYENFDPSKLGQDGCPFTPNILFDFLNGTAILNDMIAKGDIYARSLFLQMSTNVPTALENGSIRIGANIGKLPALKQGECRRIDWCIPMMNRVIISVTLRTESSTVFIAPNGSVLDAVNSYSISNVNGKAYQLIGYRSANEVNTIWMIFSMNE